MSPPRLARVALLVALAAVWSVAAYLLWQSRVPASLHLPHVAVDRYFTAAQLHAAESYGRFASVDWALTVVVELVVFVAYARWGVRFARESAAGPVGTGNAARDGRLRAAVAGGAPVRRRALWWQRRHHLTRVGYFAHIFGNWLALGGQFVFLCLALAIVMGLARRLGNWWWLPAAPIFVGLATLFAFVTPYLLATHPLRDPVLRSGARARADRARRHTRSSSRTCTTSHRCRTPRRQGSGRAGASCCGTPCSTDGSATGSCAS